jgi:hypothetical protein
MVLWKHIYKTGGLSGDALQHWRTFWGWPDLRITYLQHCWSTAGRSNTRKSGSSAICCSNACCRMLQQWLALPTAVECTAAIGDVQVHIARTAHTCS